MIHRIRAKLQVGKKLENAQDWRAIKVKSPSRPQSRALVSTAWTFPGMKQIEFRILAPKIKRNQNALNRSKCKKMFVVVVAVFETLLSKVVTKRNLISPRWRNVFVPDFSAKKLGPNRFLVGDTSSSWNAYRLTLAPWQPKTRSASTLIPLKINSYHLDEVQERKNISDRPRKLGGLKQ